MPLSPKSDVCVNFLKLGLKRGFHSGRLQPYSQIWTRVEVAGTNNGTAINVKCLIVQAPWSVISTGRNLKVGRVGFSTLS